MTDANSLVTTEDRARVRILRLNRPKKKNALTGSLGWAIVNAIREAAADDDVWVIGLTGTGDGFCSGLDLSDSGSEEGNPFSPQSQMTDDLGWVSQFPLVMREECEKPIVGGINGVAIGAGFSLAMATDIRLASSNARFLAGYARAGTSPDGGLTWTLAQALGYEGALRFLLEQEMISADEALARGIVGEVVAAEDFEVRFFEYCELLTGVSPIAARQSKRMVGKAVELPSLRTHLSVEIGAARRGLQTEDSKEAVRAIMEKRKPVFTGR
jgi:2-(1,2-epoxy-1,2-dihydrophenyl)acetyl-CoA isomerase